MTEIDWVAALEIYRGEHPLGAKGDESMRASLGTRIVETTNEDVRRNRLEVAEMDDFLAYAGWNLWDLLARRSTEGESGLIPRQEYETVAFVQQWLTFPHLYGLITDAVGGPDGVVDLGATARREPANKLNNTRAWVNMCSLIGRGLLITLDMQKPYDRLHELNTAIQFQRRIQHGVYGGGPGFASGRSYDAQMLGSEWIDRFSKRFNAATELFGFLLMFDTRSGTNTSGPYPLPDGSTMLVRDHFLHEPLYPWMDAAAGLPYCVTQVMVFDKDAPRFLVNDIGTTFTEPAVDYFEHLTHFSVYARDTWDTPATELRKLDRTEQEQIAAGARTGLNKLYRRIASMSRRDRIMAGVLVYTREMMAPFARAAGLWDHFVDDLQFDELHPMTADAYYPLTTGKAQELLPPAFILGQAFAPVGSSPTW
jgi:hypothetical protein